MRNCNVTTSKLIASDKHIILRWYTPVRGFTKLNFYKNKITLNAYIPKRSTMTVQCLTYYNSVQTKQYVNMCLGS